MVSSLPSPRAWLGRRHLHTVLDRGLDSMSYEFEQSATRMQQLLGSMDSTLQKAREGGGDTAIKRHRSRGKLLPRERIDLILDEGSPFLELSPLAGHGMYGAKGRADVIRTWHSCIWCRDCAQGQSAHILAAILNAGLCPFACAGVLVCQF
jgi:hypothetical protein